MSNYKSYSETNTLRSVGIDIGTTSCHLVFSLLRLANEASSTQIPKLAIKERTVLYESEVYFTPLNDDGTIHGAGVAEILRSEYSKSGFTPDDINCGAVIITGETARLRNAEDVLHRISALAGDFVAASAGPELESVLAGRGSGALQYSQDMFKTICNIDIGGGTTNIAIFRNGEVSETACVRIGGRCLRFSENGYFTGSTGVGDSLLKMSGIYPSSLKNENLPKFASFIANKLMDIITAVPSQWLGSLLTNELTTPETEVDEYWFSGGVAALMKTESDEPFRYGDFGWFLARAMNEKLKQREISYRIAENPIRATVLGAGSFSVQLSGNTVYLSASKLPVKSVPLVRPFHDLPDFESCPIDYITNRLRNAIALYDKKLNGRLVAITLDLPPAPRFKTLKTWAVRLAAALKDAEVASPYILITNTDSAMALGQLLRGTLDEMELVVLDGIELNTGDYIDIGKPLPGATTIPVTVKSLIFAGEHD